MDTKNNTKKRIADALVQLLYEYNADEITVAALVAKAEVSKSTFYRHFSDVYDVYDLLFEDLSRRCLRIILDILLHKKIPLQLRQEKEVVSAEVLAEALAFSEDDAILAQKLLDSKDIRLISQLTEQVHKCIVPLARQRGLDVNRASFYTRFITNGTILLVLDSYNRHRCVDAAIVMFLLRLDVSALLPGGVGI